jgi:hypothetical protein
MIVRTAPPDHARGVAITDKVQSGVSDELSHPPMVARNELGAKLDHIAIDRAGSGSSADLVAGVEDDHLMCGGGQRTAAVSPASPAPTITTLMRVPIQLAEQPLP